MNGKQKSEINYINSQDNALWTKMDTCRDLKGLPLA